jgi:hypothetical protein
MGNGRFAQIMELEDRDVQLDESGREAIAGNPHLRPMEIEACSDNYDRFARRWMWIRIHGGNTRLRFKPDQRTLHETVCTLRKDKRPVRVRILKARQVGMSTYVEGDGFHHTRFNADFPAQVVAHDLKGANKIYGIFKYYQTMLKEKAPWMALRTPRDSGRLMQFANHSEMRVDTAKDMASGRSGSLSWLHCSELAFWPGDPKETKTSLYQSVRAAAGTTIFEESTANGIGNDWYNSWRRTQKLMDAKKETDWINLFFPWWHEPEYVLAVSRREAEWIMSHLDGEERWLVERFKLTPGQLKWRRKAIRDKCEGDIEIFKREYPAFAEEAFRSTGKPYFDVKVLVGWRQDVEPALEEDPRRGYVEAPLAVSVPRVAGTNIPGRLPNGTLVRGVENRDYEIQAKIFEQPIPRMQYVIGADVAEGQTPIHRLKTTDPDYNVGSVHRVDNYDQVAIIRGRWEPDIFAEALYALGRIYNWAVIGPEGHQIGDMVIGCLTRETRERSGYPRVYMTVNPKGGGWRWGWETTGKTRPTILSESRALIREKIGILRDIDTIDEHLAMETTKEGKILPRAGHDDTVLARAIACAIIAHLQQSEDFGEFTDEATDPDGMMHEYESRMYEQAQVDYDREYDWEYANW